MQICYLHFEKLVYYMPSKYNIGEQDYLIVYNICFTQNVKRKYGFLCLSSNGQRNLTSKYLVPLYFSKGYYKHHALGMNNTNADKHRYKEVLSHILMSLALHQNH